MSMKKKESIKVRISGTLDNFLDRQASQMSKQAGQHVTKSEVTRKILNMYMYLDMDPNTDLGKLTMYAAEFEDFLKQEYDVDDKEDLMVE